MMERKRALTIPFAVEKDKLMENPLRIPTSYLECERLERQVSWTAIADYKFRHRDSQHKNGSLLFDHNHAAMVRLGLAMKKPRLILTDVLKTEPGKAYMERIKRNQNLRTNEQLSGKRKKRGRGKDRPNGSRDRTSCQTKETNLKSKSVTPKSKQTPKSSSSRRSRLKRRTQTDDDKGDINDLQLGGNENFEVAEVVDCGLSVSWEPEDVGGCKLSPTKIKDTLEEPENEIQKMNKKDLVSECTGSECTGPGSPKHLRESVLCLSGVDTKDGENAEDGDLENFDRGILQFTVGEDEKNAEPIVPFIFEAGNVPGSPNDDNGTLTTAEPIVLSSDDEEEGDGNITQSPTQMSLTAGSPQQKADDLEDVQVLQLVVNEHSDTMKDTCLCFSFTTLHCGRYQGKANGDILITNENIIIPITDTSEEGDLMLTLERKELRRYSVWEKQELETLNIFCNENFESIPAAGLLCCVSKDAAEGIQYDLSQLCDKRDRTKNTEKPSPFILIFLQDPLEGMEGAFLRSLLDIDCLNFLDQEKSLSEYDHTILGPVLSLEESLELIKTSGLDPHLLTFLSQESSKPSTDKDCRLLDSLENTSCIEPDAELQQEIVLQQDKEPEHEMPSQLEEMSQPQENLDCSSEKSTIEPVYTLCHRRLKDSYSVTICKPDSNWVKYKHQGLARRLIQFPPPPLKGGITVTMEDLQCLDSGQYLNDVIIDFYLKYLLQNATESVAGRSHIFSSFFYKQLTRRDNASEGSHSDSCQRQKRYQRVRTWTRHVDIFNKDFLFVPVNQEAHWYLVVICFPGLDEPKIETWTSVEMDEIQDQDECQVSTSPTDNMTASHTINSDNTETENSQKEATKDPPSAPVNCTENTCQRKAVCKRPCILVMDSLKRSPHERVFKLLREYLQSEWEARRGSPREFGPDQMESSHCQVPLQDNSSDCGLYLLQYVECFLKDPLVHFDLPLQLKNWFPRHQVRRKRDEIRDLVLKLYRHQNVDKI